VPPPPADRMPATFREWVEVIARTQFGTVRLCGKNHASSRIKLVAGRLANYADSDGTRVRPGIARLAVDVNIDYRAARAIVAYLRDVGLLQLVRVGGRNGTDEYRLSLPVDLLERDDFEVWSPSRHRLEIERLSESHRRLPRTPPRGPGTNRSPLPEGAVMEEESPLPEGAVKEPNEAASQGPEGAVEHPDDDPITAPSGTSKSPITAPSGTASLLPQGPATDQDRNTRATDQPDGDVEAAVTGPRATAPATNPDSSPRPQRCAHGLPGRLRSDGRPACALCRVAEDRPATHLAPVIQLHAREAS
jgi:hypothetical protein